MQKPITTVDEYLAALSPERREALTKLRAIILKNLPAGYKEGILYGMISYYIPLSTYSTTYNGQPLGIMGLASQKNYMSLYLTSIYMNEETEKWFKQKFKEAGKKLDMGKSCLRFRRLDDLPLELIGQVAALVTADQFIALYELSRSKK